MVLLQVELLPDVTVATFTARSLGEANAEAFMQELSDLVGRLDGRGLHLDIGAVELLTSMGLAKLVWLYKQVQAGGGRLSLRNVRPEVYEVLVATRLVDLLDVRRAPEGRPAVPESA